MSANASRPLMLSIARVASCALLSYWLVYALVAPVATVDSLVYNIARVKLAMQGGLFDNSLFTSCYQVMYPWAYDALHLPFVLMGWGYVLPSYACLFGTCVIIYIMMKERYGPTAGWMAVLGVLGLSCLVYQGASTKNDIPIVFCGAVFVYARDRWKNSGRKIHVVMTILAIGLMAGSKTTGLVYGAAMAAWILCEERKSKRRMAKIMVGLAVAYCLLGSLETYIESMRQFGNPLGPTKVVAKLENPDGLRGGIANFSRHLVGSIYVGPVNFRSDSVRAAETLAALEYRFLRAFGLEHAGMNSQFQTLPYLPYQSGMEELSGFGPVGTIAMATMLLACFLWRPRSLWWRMAAAGLLGMILVSVCIGYTQWLNRYLIGFYTLGFLGFSAGLWDCQWRHIRILRWVVLVLCLASALAVPLLSINRKPQDIVEAVMNRDRYEVCACPLVGNLMERLRLLHEQNPNSALFYIVSDDSVVLPFLERPIPNLSMVRSDQVGAWGIAGRFRAGDFLIVDAPADLKASDSFALVSAPDVYNPGRMLHMAIYRLSKSRPNE